VSTERETVPEAALYTDPLIVQVIAGAEELSPELLALEELFMPFEDTFT
jgi:hypothetical protein